jgi:hypothetical protein
MYALRVGPCEDIDEFGSAAARWSRGYGRIVIGTPSCSARSAQSLIQMRVRSRAHHRPGPWPFSFLRRHLGKKAVDGTLQIARNAGEFAARTQ